MGYVVVHISVLAPREGSGAPSWRSRGRVGRKADSFQNEFTTKEGIVIHLNAQQSKIQLSSVTLVHIFLVSVLGHSTGQPSIRQRLSCPGQWLVPLCQPPESSGLERGCPGG